MFALFLTVLLDPSKAESCKKISQAVFKALPWITKNLRDLAWDAKAFCAVVIPVCKLPCCKENNAPEQVRLAIGDAPNSMTVTWSTLSATGNVSAIYGLSEASLTNVAPALPRTYTAGGWVGTIHMATLENLAPNATYYYRVGGGSGLWSKTFSFRTLSPNVGTPEIPLRIVQIGDMDFGEAGAPTVAAVSKLIDAGKVDLVLHVGDISYADGYQSHWDDFMRLIEPIASRVPYMVGPGNHEFWFNFTSYRTRFSMPNRAATENMYYSFNVGKNLHVMMLNSETFLDTADFDDQQIKWMRQDLADNKLVPWKLATFHRPMYCTSKSLMQCDRYPAILRFKAEDVLMDGRVDVVINGHIHSYERTWPVRDGGKVTAESYANPAAPVYIVNGAGGNREGQGTNQQNQPWSAYTASNKGFVFIVVKGPNKFVSHFIDSVTGEMIDAIEISK